MGGLRISLASHDCTRFNIGASSRPTPYLRLRRFPAPPQYVARPPEQSNTAPVVKEHSSLASQVIRAAISSTVPKRPIGILDSMKSMCSCVIWSKIAVRTAAGVTQFTVILVLASSLPSDFVRPITAALEAE